MYTCHRVWDVGESPVAKCREDGEKRSSPRRQVILVASGTLLGGQCLHDTPGLEPVQPLRQDVTRDPLWRGGEITKSDFAGEEVAHDE